eukprot:2390201-Amphidinium_carterae.2
MVEIYDILLDRVKASLHVLHVQWPCIHYFLLAAFLAYNDFERFVFYMFSTVFLQTIDATGPSQAKGSSEVGSCEKGLEEHHYPLDCEAIDGDEPEDQASLEAFKVLEAADDEPTSNHPYYEGDFTVKLSKTKRLSFSGSSDRLQIEGKASLSNQEDGWCLASREEGG